MSGITQNDLVFLVEMFASSVERGLLGVLFEDPERKADAEVYADYLEENGRLESAKMVREKGYVPGRKTAGERRTEEFVYRSFTSGYSSPPSPAGPSYPTFKTPSRNDV